MMPQRDDLLLRLPCYEPAGRTVTLTLDELTQHWLIIGTTGSGKTTILNEVLWQLLHYRAQEPGPKPGILILDAKGDDTVAKVRAWSRAAGRERDVRVLDGKGESFVSVFGALTRVEAVDTLTSQLLAGVARFSSGESFWEDARSSALRAVLTALVFLPRPLSHGELVERMAAWLLRNEPPEPALKRIRLLVESPHLSAYRRQRLAAVLTFVTYWHQLDYRTRSNIQETLVPVLDALEISEGEGYFAAPMRGSWSRAPRWPTVKFRSPASAAGGAAGGRVAAHCYGARRNAPGHLPEQRRGGDRPDARHLAGAGGGRAGAYADPNGEPQCLCLPVLPGTRSRGVRPPADEAEAATTPDPDGMDFLIANRPPGVHLPEPVCPLGSLGRLAANQAYVVVGAHREVDPMWFVPRYFEAETAPETVPDAPSFLPEPEQTLLAARTDRAVMRCNRQLLPQAELVTVLGNRFGPEQAARWRTELKQLLKFCRLGLVSEASLASLPGSWAKGLVALLVSLVQRGQPERPGSKLVHLRQWGGRLILQFAKEPAEDQFDPSWAQVLRGRLAAPLYPSVYRPLRRKDLGWLGREHPNLRPALDRLHGTSTPAFT
ncbi:MAG: Type secretion-system coupling protein DNA-binding domain [Verrucomicrobiota bacterium]|jgi:energy-coupling factor transporter ATP-binding protein EcfA2